MTKKITNNLGDRISDTAAIKGIGIGDLARMIGCSRGYMTQLVKNEVRHPHKYLESLAKYLDVDKDWLLTGTGSSVTEERKRRSGLLLKAKVIPSAIDQYCRIKIPYSELPKNIKCWFFNQEQDLFPKNTLIITENDYTPGTGLFLAYEQKNDSHILVGKKDTLDGQVFIRKSEDAKLIGRILVLSHWAGEVVYDNE